MCQLVFNAKAQGRKGILSFSASSSASSSQTKIIEDADENEEDQKIHVASAARM
jgi:hypothetical protein